MKQVQAMPSVGDLVIELRCPCGWGATLRPGADNEEGAKQSLVKNIPGRRIPEEEIWKYSKTTRGEKRGVLERDSG